MKKLLLFFTIFLNLALSFFVSAEPADDTKILLRGDTLDMKYNYSVGEEITFRILFGCGKNIPTKGWKLAVERFGEDGVRETSSFPAVSGKIVAYRTKGKAPGFVIVRVRLLNEKNAPVLAPDNQPVRYTGGIGVEIEKLKAEACPPDFDSYWNKVVRGINASSAKATLTSVPSYNPAVKLYIFQIPCGKNMETTGYISIPVKLGKYPAAVEFIGYGGVHSVPRPKMNADTITMTVSRYGILPEQNQEYYNKAKQQTGGFGVFCFRNNESRETCDFKGMIVRDLTALKFLKSRPEWDGKRLSVSGGSMGGLQAIWMAALDRSVTETAPEFPWCCDVNARALRKVGSDFMPSYIPALRYFDAVNFARRIPRTCTVRFSTGIGDTFCPVGGVFRAYLNVPGPKSIRLIQGPTHAPCHPKPQVYEFSGNPVPAN